MNIDRFLIDESKTLVWTLTSHGYQFLTHNLYRMISKCAKWRLCIICADDASYQYMRRENIPAIRSEIQLPDFGINISPFGSGNFQRLNLLKLRILDSLARDVRIKKCIYMDGDIAVYKDFVPDILERLENDGLLFQCDEQKRNIVCATYDCPTPCTGFIAWSHGADRGIFAMNDREEWLKKPEDQVWVGNKLREHGIVYKTLERNLYPNGTFVTQENIREYAYILHYNYRIGNVKVADMKRFGDWFLVV